jgi:transaldolase
VDDYGGDGMAMLTEIRGLYDAQGYETEILAASIRTAAHVAQAALAGADAATIPPVTFAALVKHPLTELGLDRFMSDWKKTGQSIL